MRLKFKGARVQRFRVKRKQNGLAALKSAALEEHFV